MSEVSYDERKFWKSYIYACDHRCGWERRFYLEVGLEGPRQKKIPNPRDVEDLPYPEPDTVLATDSGRVVLPVPFVASGCPNCQPDGPPFYPDGGTLQHVLWGEDQELEDLIEGKPPGPHGNQVLPHFLYPRNPEADQACGVPVVPGYLEATPQRLYIGG